MTTDWSEEKFDAETPAERNGKKALHVNHESLAPMPTPQIDQPLINGGGNRSPPPDIATGNAGSSLVVYRCAALTARPRDSVRVRHCSAPWASRSLT
jgi:hypothetical protein